MDTASTLTRSLSLSPRARTARFRSHTHCPFSAAGTSPRGLPLRRANSDAAATLARSPAAVLHHAPAPPILKAPDEVEPARHDGAGGSSGGGSSGGTGGGDGSGCGLGEYYRRVLRADPGNPLLLRNYGTYLHGVERDLAGAEACYARALLAAPGDADLLSLYARVIWEASQEKDRAAGYFERAVQAAPDDCYVLGSYASFLWDTEEDEDDDKEAAAAPADLQRDGPVPPRGSPAMVPAC